MPLWRADYANGEQRAAIGAWVRRVGGLRGGRRGGTGLQVGLRAEQVRPRRPLQQLLPPRALSRILPPMPGAAPPPAGRRELGSPNSLALLRARRRALAERGREQGGHEQRAFELRQLRGRLHAAQRLRLAAVDDQLDGDVRDVDVRQLRRAEAVVFDLLFLGIVAGLNGLLLGSRGSSRLGCARQHPGEYIRLQARMWASRRKADAPRLRWLLEVLARFFFLAFFGFCFAPPADHSDCGAGSPGSSFCGGARRLAPDAGAKLAERSSWSCSGMASVSLVA